MCVAVQSWPCNGRQECGHRRHAAPVFLAWLLADVAAHSSLPALHSLFAARFSPLALPAALFSPPGGQACPSAPPAGRVVLAVGTPEQWRPGSMTKPPYQSLRLISQLLPPLGLCGRGQIARAADGYCRFPVVGLAWLPMASPETSSSTLRFCCRPAELPLEATGSVLPKPLALTELVDTPSCTR